MKPQQVVRDAGLIVENHQLRDEVSDLRRRLRERDYEMEMARPRPQPVKRRSWKKWRR